MKKLNKYLSSIQEREWDEPDSWEEFTDIGKLKATMRDLSIDTEEMNTNRNKMQPTVLGLDLPRGGDYRGRQGMRNTTPENETGWDYVSSYLPKGFEKQLRWSLNIKRDFGWDESPDNELRTGPDDTPPTDGAIVRGDVGGAGGGLGDGGIGTGGTGMGGGPGGGE
jgi:hypothetical protein